MKPFDISLTLFVWYFVALEIHCAVKMIPYMSIERLIQDYRHPEYVSDFVVNSKRYGRRDVMYYINVDFTTKFWIDNNLTVHFYFFEWLTNQYKRSFVEMHHKACDLIHNSLFLGMNLLQGKANQPCPYPPDHYAFRNITIPSTTILNTFPFTKARIFINLSLNIGRNDIIICSSHCDMELKQMKIKT